MEKKKIYKDKWRKSIINKIEEHKEDIENKKENETGLINESVQIKHKNLRKKKKKDSKNKIVKNSPLTSPSILLNSKNGPLELIIMQNYLFKL